ncbi:MAG: hypothetical protein P1U34_10870 [Coxiellaceae bacterium]|nr:hypothetical protein [Coxiellaceae bacterium]
MTRAVIHYIWIGPPPTLTSKTILGQDILGPKAFTAACNFWCLAAHEGHYKSTFAAQPNITVRAIEPHIANYTADEKVGPLADQALALFDFHLNSAERDTTRDRVTIKDLTAYFLLYTEGGYTVDTNILLKKPEALVEQEKFGYPQYLTTGSSDVWMMYSPQHFERTRLSLETYIYLHQQANADRTLRPGTSGYHQRCGEILVLHSLLLKPSAALDSCHLDQATPWETKKNPRGTICYIECLGATKYFYNSHHLEASRNQLLVFTQDNQLDKLANALDLGESIDQTHDIGDYKNLTLALYAVLNCTPKTLALLLRYNPNLDIAMEYKEVAYTAQSLLETQLRQPTLDTETRARKQQQLDLIIEYKTTLAETATTSSGNGSGSGKGTAGSSGNPYRLLASTAITTAPDPAGDAAETTTPPLRSQEYAY